MKRIKNRKMVLKLFRNKIRITVISIGEFAEEEKVCEVVYGIRIRKFVDENEELDSVIGEESQKEMLINAKEYLSEFATKES